jgi:mannose-6-phosphate isomerase-like protein (cupin superfamily)
MAYGLTLDQVRRTNRPTPQKKSWGSVTSLTEMEEYAMVRVVIEAGCAQPLHFFPSEYRAFVESGEVVVRGLDSLGGSLSGTARAGEVLPLPRFHVHGFASVAGVVVYLFGPRSAEGLPGIPVETEEAAASAFGALDFLELRPLGQPTEDVREKYWGRIETILSGEVAAKRIFVVKGGQSSLEYHVEKRESYYIHSGLLRVGLRIGRAENRSIVMEAGESYDVKPGVMHMRIGLEDTVILEVSTRDSDADSYLVEDGMSYHHIDADFNSESTQRQEQPK